MNVKNRALAIIGLVILLLAGFFFYQGIVQHNRQLDSLMLQEERHVNTIVEDINRYSLLPYLVKIEHISTVHGDLVAAFARRDRKALYQLARREFGILRQENEYVHAFDFNLPDGTVFLRVQRPDLHGDNIAQTRRIVSYVHENREAAAGYDVGKHGAIYWVAQPLYYGGEYIGAMEIGISVRQVVDAIRKRLSAAVSVIIHPQQWQKAEFVGQGFRQLPEHILVTAESTAFDQIPDDFDFDRPRQRLTIDGRVHLVHSHTELRDYTGKPVGNIVVLQDISASLAQKSRFVVHSVVLVIAVLGAAFGVIWWAMAGLVGRLELCARENLAAREEIQRSHDRLENRVRQRTAELAGANVALQEEVAERKQAEERFSAQHAFLKNIIESLTHPFYVIDVESHAIVLANEAAYAMTDRPRENLTCHAMTHNQDEPCSGKEHVCALAQVRRTGKPAMVEHIHTDKSGAGHYFEIYAYPIFDSNGRVREVIEYTVDITDRKRSEEEKRGIWAQLLQAQKMEAIGVLAGGVAHDFNNVLTSIIGNAQLAKMVETRGGEPVRPYLDQIMSSSNRAVSLVRQLLLFSRRQATEQHEPINLNETIRNILKMLNRLIGEDVVIKAELAPGVWTVNADVGNIEQVITNLVVNARDAMPGGGEIVISTKNLGIDQDLEKQIHHARLGHFVLLSVADTGCGIDREAIDHIFEPFFTTKEARQGTGLGLSIVQGVIEQHGGWINVYSEPGKGTIFNIYLPASAEAEYVEEALEGVEEFLAYRQFGKGRLVLLVEDEADVREVAMHILEGMGFSVLVADDVAAARAVFKREGEWLDLVFSDVTLPDGNGVELALEFLEQIPGLKVLMTSGYPDHRSRLSIIREQKLRFILKPYGVAELEKAIRETLADEG